MTTRLDLYNLALLECGERSISSLAEDREPRRNLDQVWNGGWVNYCLEQGQWHFAMNAIRIDPDPAIDPQFGYGYAYQKPDDWVLTSAVTEDEFFRIPLNQYTDELGYIYSDCNPIYFRYVSNSVLFGNDLGKWPATFTQYAAYYGASKIIVKLSESREKLEEIRRDLKQALVVAKNKAAMAEPTAFAARGSWSRARTRGTKRGDGGNTTGNLY
jgi:hypothetical protein